MSNPIKHCAGCRHWDTSRYLDDHNTVGDCDRITQATGLDDKAYVDDGDRPGSATLVTAPDFGCSLHEPIEARG
jgi:hypothetical protein